MKHLKYLFLLIFPIVIISCSTSYEQNQVGMEKLDADLKKQFGPDAWYTSIGYSMAPDNENVYVVAVDKTDKPESMMQERWLNDAKEWQKVANVNVDVKNGKPEDYMFQLDKNNIKLAKLGELISTSKTEVEKAKSEQALKLKIAVVATNNVVLNAADRFTYTIIWEGKDKQSYSLTYGLDGSLKNKNF